MKRRLCYLLFVVTGIYFVMLYDFRGLRFLAVCLVCIPLLYLVLLIPQTRGCTVSLEAEADTVVREDMVKLMLTVENRGLLPISRIWIRGVWKGPGEDQQKIQKWLCGIRGRHTTRVCLEFPALHCGRGEFILTRAGVCDYSGIFALSARKRSGSAQVCVLPRPISIPRQAMDPAVLRIRNGERDGDVFVRDFHPGDSIHRVYWKLSTKTDQLQVRDREVSASVTFYLEGVQELRTRPDQWDDYLDRACSLMCFFLENDVPGLWIAWQEEQGGADWEVHEAEDVWTWVYGLLMHKEAIRFREGQDAFPAPGFCLREDGRLFLGEQCVYE